MASGPMSRIKAKKNYQETEESGTFWRSMMIEIDTRLRVARGIGKTETHASVSKSLKGFNNEAIRMRHRPPFLTDGVELMKPCWPFMVKCPNMQASGVLPRSNNRKRVGNICK